LGASPLLVSDFFIVAAFSDVITVASVSTVIAVPSSFLTAPPVDGVKHRE
jgi:hypothetical protein